MQFSPCTVCKGFGTIESIVCTACRGRGLVGRFAQALLVWDYPLDTRYQAERKMERGLRKLLNGLLLLFGIVALLAFMWHVARGIGITQLHELFTLSFWKTPHPARVAFAAALLVEGYLYYRLVKEGSLKKPIPFQKLQQEAAVTTLADTPSAATVNVADSYALESVLLVEKAFNLAKKFHHADAVPLHIFASLLSSEKVSLVFGRLEVSYKPLAKTVSRMLNIFPTVTHREPAIHPDFRSVLLTAYAEAEHASHAYVTPGDILVATLAQDATLQDVLVEVGVDLQKVRNVGLWLEVIAELRTTMRSFRTAARFKPKKGMDRAMTAVATPYLNHFSHDLTLRAKMGQLAPVLGREKEVEAIFRIMQGEGRSIILIGEPGVGKTAIVEGLARRMTAENVPKFLQDKRLIAVNVAALVSGATPYQAEERMMAIGNEVARSGNVVLFIKNIQDVIGITAGAEQSLDLSEVLVQFLTARQFFIIASTTPQEYAKYVETTALGDILQAIRIEEPEQNETIQILEAKSVFIEARDKVYFSYKALEAAYTLAKQYLADRYLPEKAILLLEETAAFVRGKRGEKSLVSDKDIADLIAEKTGIPVTQLTEKEGEKLLHLESRFHERMIDQEEAVSTLAKAIKRARVAFRDANRPIANVLFLGPTGVGKTELAKTVAEVYFGGEDNMIRLDMSEYQESSSIRRLIGAAPGSGTGASVGYLTEAVRRQPFSLVLLDELEKAHSGLLDVFLQVFDDGRLTDNQGRTVDFTNTIIIATSNAGTRFIQEEVVKGTPLEKIREILMEQELKAYYRPEFLNRFDAVVVFKPLSLLDVEEIAKLMLKKVAARLEAKGMYFEATHEAISELARKGFDPQFGARPLRRVIQNNVDDVLTDFLLTNRLKRRDTVVLEKGGRISVRAAKKLVE